LFIAGTIIAIPNGDNPQAMPRSITDGTFTGALEEANSDKTMLRKPQLCRLTKLQIAPKTNK
jgi:hypothetical protein